MGLELVNTRYEDHKGDVNRRGISLASAWTVRHLGARQKTSVCDSAEESVHVPSLTKEFWKAHWLVRLRGPCNLLTCSMANSDCDAVGHMRLNSHGVWAVMHGNPLLSDMRQGEASILK